MVEMTLREFCEQSGISRRAIQGYEKKNLVHASGRNELGYLLYDEATQDRIRKIRFYNDIGFKVSEIGDIIDVPKEVERGILRKQIIVLEQDKVKKDILIAQAYEMMK